MHWQTGSAPDPAGGPGSGGTLQLSPGLLAGFRGWEGEEGLERRVGERGGKGSVEPTKLGSKLPPVLSCTVYDKPH